MDKNLRLFSSTLHKAVWRTSIDYFPLEYSTANIKDPELLQSCQEFYHYIIDGLEDVLEHPEEYRDIPEKYLIIFCGILTFHHYMLERFLEKACIKEKDHLVIDNVEYDNLLCWVKKKICNRELKLDCLMKTLGRKGIRITRDENQTVIRNDRYPHMFYSAALLKQVAVNYYNRTKRTPEQFKLLDFVSIGNERRKLILEDVIAPLYDDEKEYVYRFVDETKKKVRLTCSCRLWYYRTSKFKYKGKVLFLAN